VGSTVATSPAQVTPYFTQQLEPKFSGGEVHNAAGAPRRSNWRSLQVGPCEHAGLISLKPGQERTFPTAVLTFAAF